ncbi:MAG: hypothetical protein D6696_16825 [Acidobacteria bacterium]|nr:MAG: hypothetical protein D6696_16825 [Acidobacteriota bacterium]
MSAQWKIPKKLKEVELWIHPHGRLVGALFVHLQSARFPGEQQPLEILNEDRPFVVVKRRRPDEVRFYKRSAIVRVEYREDPPLPHEGATALSCQLHMMDGSLIEGTIVKPLPPDQSRLFDLLNDLEEQFLKIDGDDGRVCLVNKAYVVYATQLGGEDG